MEVLYFHSQSLLCCDSFNQNYKTRLLSVASDSCSLISITQSELEVN